MEHYEKYEFHMVYRRILNFCAVELSSIYFDISKDILYVEAKTSKKRRANLMVLNEINECLVRLVSPVLSFTAEEIWKFMGRGDSVHMQTYYELDEKFNNADVDARMEQVVNIKKDVLKALEVLRRDGAIKTSQEADVTIFTARADVRDLCRAMGDDFRRFLQVARAMIVEEKEGSMQDYESSSIAGSRTSGKKCVRCWNYYESLGSDPEHPELCERCTGVVKSL
jgi:isoleucyl-tRNA synthetase